MADIDPSGTTLTERQVQVLQLRERGLTQREVADRIDTTASNVSAVERNARTNIERARRTLECARVIRTAARFRAAPGTPFDDLVARVYDLGDEHDLQVDYRKPELYAHLFETLEEQVHNGQTTTAVEVGLAHDGAVIARPVDESG